MNSAISSTRQGNRWRSIVFAVAFLIVGCLPIGIACADNPVNTLLFGIGEETLFEGGSRLKLLRSPLLPDFPVGEWKARLTFNSEYGDYYRSGGLENGDASYNRRLGVSSTYLWRGRHPWRLTLHGGNRNLHLYAPDVGPDRRFTLHSNVSEIGLEGQVWVGHTSLVSRASILSGTLLQGEAGARYDDPRSRFTVESLAGQKQSTVTTDVHADGAYADLGALGIERFGIGRGRVRLAGPISIQAKMQVSWFSEMEEKPDRPRYQPTGDMWQWDAAIVHQRDRGLIGIGARGLNMELQSSGRIGEYSFSKLTYIDASCVGGYFEMRNRLFGTSTNWLSELEVLSFEGYSRGHVEFWPWTTQWIDMLGLRRYYTANLEGVLSRLHLGGSGMLGERWKISGGVHLLDLHPKARVDSWRPAYLVFGVEDYTRTYLTVDRHLSALLTMGVEYSQPAGSIRYTFMQWVPIQSWEKKESGPPSPQPEPGSGGGRSRIYGGGMHSLQFVLLFN